VVLATASVFVHVIAMRAVLVPVIALAPVISSNPA